MLKILHKAEAGLPNLLVDESAWNGVFADSEKPHLRRLWRQWGDYRLYLHHFTHCEPTEEFPHPHPWQMAVRILEGQYAMGTGRSANLDQPPILSHQTYQAGDSYQMLDADEWHAIRPLDSEALTIMVAGPVVYPQNRIKANKISRELTAEERSALFARIRRHYT